MFEKLKNSVQVIFGLLLIGLIIYVSVVASVWLLEWFKGVNDVVQTGTITALPIVIVAIIGYFANKSIETKRAVEQAMRPKKLELYTEFNEFLMRIFANEEVVKKPSEKEITKYFARKTPELITFASNSVIERWGRLRVGLEETNSNEHKMFLVENMLNEIRADLGHGKRGHHKGDILRLFVNDIDQYLKK